MDEASPYRYGIPSNSDRAAQKSGKCRRDPVLFEEDFFHVRSEVGADFPFAADDDAGG